MPFKPLVNFKSDNTKSEFASVDPSLKQALSSAPGYSFITSGKRDEGTNKSVGGVQNSFHLTGQAVDLRKRETSASTLKHLKEQGYQIIDEGDHYHVEPAGKKPMPFKPLSAPTGQPDLEALGRATAPAKQPSGWKTPNVTAAGVQMVNPDVKNDIDAGNVDATTKARLLAEQQIKEAIDKKLIDTLEKAAADKGTTIDKLSRQDFQTIAKGNSKEAGELYDRLNPKFDGMSGDAAKIKEIAEGGLRQTDALGKEIMAGNKLFGASLPFGLGDRKTAFIKDDLVDLIGRLRSGGAITEGTKGGEGGEAARFERLIPGWMDFTKEEKLYKLNELGLKFQGIAESMKSDKKFVPFKTGNEQPQAVDPASDPYFGLSPEDKAALQEAEKQGY